MLGIVLDATRVDHFGVYGYERDATPNIDAFAAGATRFTRVIAEGSLELLEQIRALGYAEK